MSTAEEGGGVVNEGDCAPPFDLVADDGSQVRLGALKGQKVVLFFYPKDDTPGCTIEACEFRDDSERFDAEGALILGVSPDPVSSHVRFKRKYDLAFPLLADEGHQIAERYGVWKEKSMYGRTYWGVERSTFLIGEDGTVLRVWRKVRPQGHAREVAAVLSSDPSDVT
jgi:peroxiredoxin Q/BCP